MPSFAFPPPRQRRRGRTDPVLLGLFAGVAALAIVLNQPVEATNGGQVSPTPAALSDVGLATGTNVASAPDQWARGVSLDLERLRPAATGTPAPAAQGGQATPIPGNPPTSQSSQAAGGQAAPAFPSTVTSLGAKVPAAVRRFEGSVLKWSIHHKIDPNLVAAIIMTESEGNPNAVSPAGAIGLMQVMGGSFDPDENIHAGTSQFAGYLGRFGQVELALAAYNAGPNAVAQYGGVPPYQETRDHIFRVMLRYRLYSTP